MSDLAITWKNGQGDLVDLDGTLLLDDTLTNAIIISLFTDARVDGERGWWGNSFAELEMGSKLWTLHRSKQIDDILEDAERYARDALQWMITDKLVSSLSVTATNPKQSMLLLTIIVTMPNGTVEQRTFSATWSL
ncbi:phage GP46 family protein [Actinobacillus porcinus]|uniref:phage GP46 family protein n=1 Tax=Actinobacillus porcinus TaxID=51048 RepID=UPI002A9177CB|nr:phage GP46 family protein [Actinobacillus porcinus]MDY5420516.1 phage GP46 family protein [Actinobacillus porcinus]